MLDALGTCNQLDTQYNSLGGTLEQRHRKQSWVSPLWGQAVDLGSSTGTVGMGYPCTQKLLSNVQVVLNFCSVLCDVILVKLKLQSFLFLKLD